MELQTVIAALVDQVECYRRLSKLAEIQHDHVQSGQTQDLLEVLSRRQLELNRLTELELIIAPARRNWSNWLASLEQTAQEQAQQLVDESKRLLEVITLADRNDSIVLQQRRQVLGREMKQTTSATTVNRKYAAAAYGPARSQMDVRQ